MDKLIMAAEPDRFLQSPPEAYTARYENLRDVPSDVLASRVVGSLIRCEGNLNKYKQVIQQFIDECRKEYAGGA